MNRFFLGLLIVGNTFAAFEYTPADYFGLGVGRGASFMATAPAAFANNPSLFTPNQKRICLFYANPYQIAEINTSALAATYSGNNFQTGIAITNLGNSIYRETSSILSVAKTFFDAHLTMGVNIKQLSLNIKNYGGYSTFSADIGLSYNPNNIFGLHAAINHLNHPSLGRYPDEIPLRYSSGVHLVVDENAIIVAGMEKESGYAPSIIFGMQYRINNIITFSSGWCTAPSVPAAGFVLNLSNLSFFYTFKYTFNISHTHIWGFSATF